MPETIKVAILDHNDGSISADCQFSEDRRQEMEDELDCAVKTIIEINTESREKEAFDSLMALDSALESDHSLKFTLDKVLASVWLSSQTGPIKRQYGQWTLEADENGYRIYNEREDGTKVFYLVKDGPYKNPVIEAEPDLAFETPSNVNYVDANGNEAEPTDKVAGIICKDGSEVIHRFSLSSPKKPKLTLKNNGAVIVIDDEIWHLATLFSKDKNRIEGYDAYYKKAKPEAVRIIELADLDL